ncbi:phage tail protein [Vibrio vulnificus]|uniref:phage tail assembly protein T n=1 Tax=Vibrio vulnificus TaxID=672 RepID=UPI00293547EF|nr:phage tail protein [Vibrio vulnificus]
MLHSVSAQTIIEWKAYFSKHGFSRDMDNLRHAVACATNWNITAIAAHIKLDPPRSPLEFLPNYEPDDREMSDEEMMAMSAAAGGLRIECPDS